jgi:hypothetical protein
MNECDEVMIDVWNRIIIVNTMTIVDPSINEGLRGTPNNFALSFNKNN